VDVTKLQIVTPEQAIREQQERMLEEQQKVQATLTGVKPKEIPRVLTSDIEKATASMPKGEHVSPEIYQSGLWQKGMESAAERVAGEFTPRQNPAVEFGKAVVGGVAGTFGGTVGLVSPETGSAIAGLGPSPLGQAFLQQKGGQVTAGEVTVPSKFAAAIRVMEERGIPLPERMVGLTYSEKVVHPIPSTWQAGEFAGTALASVAISETLVRGIPAAVKLAAKEVEASRLAVARTAMYLQRGLPPVRAFQLGLTAARTGLETPASAIVQEWAGMLGAPQAVRAMKYLPDAGAWMRTETTKKFEVEGVKVGGKEVSIGEREVKEQLAVAYKPSGVKEWIRPEQVMPSFKQVDITKLGPSGMERLAGFVKIERIEGVPVLEAGAKYAKIPAPVLEEKTTVSLARVARGIMEPPQVIGVRYAKPLGGLPVLEQIGESIVMLKEIYLPVASSPITGPLAKASAGLFAGVKEVTSPWSASGERTKVVSRPKTQPPAKVDEFIRVDEFSSTSINEKWFTETSTKTWEETVPDTSQVQEQIQKTVQQMQTDINIPKITLPKGELGTPKMFKPPSAFKLGKEFRVRIWRLSGIPQLAPKRSRGRRK